MWEWDGAVLCCAQLCLPWTYASALWTTSKLLKTEFQAISGLQIRCKFWYLLPSFGLENKNPIKEISFSPHNKKLGIVSQFLLGKPSQVWCSRSHSSAQEPWNRGSPKFLFWGHIWGHNLLELRAYWGSSSVSLPWKFFTLMLAQDEPIQQFVTHQLQYINYNS